ncbi:MAG: EutN/CcmL family microcompartment protein [Bryobacteraceae bacterium]|nr:EutN/CcmL family microcompartment protein [Bryobacteraceae bacterium]
MRLGIVRGSVVLSEAIPSLRGTRMVIVEPVTAANLKQNNGLGGGKALIAADRLGPGVGQMVGFVEGRTAANPFSPEDVPVDAYCALIVDEVDYQPPRPEASGPASPEVRPVNRKVRK